MDWYVLAPAAATRDLWVSLQGPTAPEYGVWETPSGRPVHEILATEGPPGIHDVEWYFMPLREHYGKRLVDALWQYGDGLKVYSERMCAVLELCGARLQTWPADVRYRDGSPVEGYLAVLEEVDAPGPVHSLFRGRRVGRVTISEDVRTALRDAGMTGLEPPRSPVSLPPRQRRRLGRKGPSLGWRPCAPSRSSRPPVPPTSPCATCPSPPRVPTCSSRCTASASRSPTSCSAVATTS